MQRPAFRLNIFVVFLSACLPGFGGQQDILKSVLGAANAKTSVAGLALPEDQIVGGLKEALGKGVERAVAFLGRTNGFLTNLNVKILMPQKLQSVEKGLRLA